MNRFSTLPGPAGFLTFVTLAWLTAAGVFMAWLATPSASGPESGIRAVISRLVTGR